MTQLFRLPKQYYYDVWFTHTQNKLTMRTQTSVKTIFEFSDILPTEIWGFQTLMCCPRRLIVMGVSSDGGRNLIG